MIDDDVYIEDEAVAGDIRRRAVLGADIDTLVRVYHRQLHNAMNRGTGSQGFRAADICREEMERRGFRAYYAVEVPEPAQFPEREAHWVVAEGGFPGGYYCPESDTFRGLGE